MYQFLDHIAIKSKGNFKQFINDNLELFETNPPEDSTKREKRVKHYTNIFVRLRNKQQMHQLAESLSSLNNNNLNKKVSKAIKAINNSKNPFKIFEKLENAQTRTREKDLHSENADAYLDDLIDTANSKGTASEWKPEKPVSKTAGNKPGKPSRPGPASRAVNESFKREGAQRITKPPANGLGDTGKKPMRRRTM